MNLTTNLLHNLVSGREERLLTIKVDNLVSIILDDFEAKKTNSVTLLYLSKVLDKISNEILIEKLPYYGIRDMKLSFFQSYFCERH